MSTTPASSAALVLARRRPLQAAAVLSLVVAGAIGVALSDTDARIPAVAALAGSVALLWPALRYNRATLPFALVVGALPGALSLREQRFPAYHLIVVGVLLVATAECTTRAWYVHSNAPRQRNGRWPAGLVVLLGGGAAAAGLVMLAARARLDGAVVLTVVGAGALVAAGLLAARAADDRET